MSTIHITETDFEEMVLGSELPVLVDFWAPWCNPCKMLGPVIDEIADEVDGKALVCKVNIDEEQNLAQEYRVMSIPTLLYFKGGKVVNQMVGVRPKEELLEALELSEK
ncbi:thioredoxin [Fumia xinanensis]|uniref:Thioredoxin n=1 Tax=Fumia xinanensis TaxID=2763659 RepID=A0A926E7Z2_9FIRM|nr:thioredoxin [Fumia xinanensis]MBC8560831.1 thioredoxin [Fumia xinanensis]